MKYFLPFTAITQTVPLLPFNPRYSSQSITLQRFYHPSDSILPTGGVYPIFHCISEAANSLLYIPKNTYKGIVTLAGPCDDFTFSWAICCNNDPISNIQQGGGKQVVAFATLDNTRGPNSSPDFITPAVTAFCVGASANWSQAVLEPDGDSVFYEMSVYDSSNYVTGYSPSQPISSSTPVIFDSLTGDLRFSPTQVETDVLFFMAHEYRYDSLLQDWYLVGSVTKDAILLITAQCDYPGATDWLGVKGATGSGPAEIACNEKVLSLETNVDISCNSIATDGSDFLVVNSKGVSIPVLSAAPDSCHNSVTTSIHLILRDSLVKNDTIFVIPRIGSDLNGLTTLCGLQLPFGGHVPIAVTSCSTGLKVEAPALDKVELYPNPVDRVLNLDFENSGDRDVAIFDISGRLLQYSPIPKKYNELDLQYLPQGIYLLKISTSEYSEVRRIEKH